MVRPRWLFVLTLVLAVSAVLAPVALAGGSAGDNQYTDPLAGVHHHGGTQTSSSAPTTTPSPAPAPAAPTPTATAATSTATTPVATTATKPDGRTLPFTGYAAWVAAAMGALLVAGGLGLRRRTRA